MGFSMRRKWRQWLFFLPIFLFLPLLFSGIVLYQHAQTWNMEEKASSISSKKFDHLVLGPVAGQGLPHRLQCLGLRALNRTHYSTLVHILNSNESISFVTVFAVYNNTQSPSGREKSSDTVTVGNTTYSKPQRALAILNVFINFIQVSMPRSNVIILSDPASEFLVPRNNVVLLPIQGDYSREKLMLQRMRSYIAFLESRLRELFQRPNHINHYIFTDSDMAVVDDLGRIFDKYPHFHLALTFRNNKDQPLNSGLIAVRGTVEGILKAKAFLEVVLKVYNSKFKKASYMLGDQLALAWVIKSYASFDLKRFTKPEAFLDEIHGTTVLFLPCAVYNWTPPEGAGQFHGMPVDVKVIHFKGSRKRLMLESWNFLNSSTSNLSHMLCLILASGRTKYDF